MLSTPTLSSLLKRYEALTREIAAREAERTAVHDQILAAGRGGTRRGMKTSGPGRPARTTAQTVEVVRDAVRVLREAGEPLPRREVAARLGVKPCHGVSLAQVLATLCRRCRAAHPRTSSTRKRFTGGEDLLALRA